MQKAMQLANTVDNESRMEYKPPTHLQTSQSPIRPQSTSPQTQKKSYKMSVLQRQQPTDMPKSFKSHATITPFSPRQKNYPKPKSTQSARPSTAQPRFVHSNVSLDLNPFIIPEEEEKAMEYASGDISLHMEHCIECYKHQYCSWHDEKKYVRHFVPTFFFFF